MTDLRNYQMTTTREQRWETKLDKFGRDESMTRKEIKKWKEVFWEDSGTWSHIGWSERFTYYNNATLEGWQHFFDNELTDHELTEADYDLLQRYFAKTLMYSCGFTVEDGLYLFKVAFGESYDPERRFCLRINQEQDYRQVNLKPEYFVAVLLDQLADYVNTKPRYSHQRDPNKCLIALDNALFDGFVIPLASSISPLSYTTYGMGEIRRKLKMEFPLARQAFHKCLVYSMIPPQGAYTQDRYDLAKRAADVFLSYDNKPPEWEATYDGLKAKAEAIAESMQSGEYWAPVEED
jgi:hypothetical protein